MAQEQRESGSLPRGIAYVPELARQGERPSEKATVAEEMRPNSLGSRKSFSETDAWVYGGIGGAAFSTVFGIGLVGIFYEHEPIPGALLSLVGFCGLVAMVKGAQRRAHQAVSIFSAAGESFL